MGDLIWDQIRDQNTRFSHQNQNFAFLSFHILYYQCRTPVTLVYPGDALRMNIECLSREEPHGRAHIGAIP